MKIEIRLLRARRLAGKKGRVGGCVQCTVYSSMEVSLRNTVPWKWGHRSCRFFVFSAFIITLRRILPSWSLVPEGEWETDDMVPPEPEVKGAPRRPMDFEERVAYTTQTWDLSLLVTWHLCGHGCLIKIHTFQFAFLTLISHDFYCVSYLKKKIPPPYYNSELSQVLSGARWSLNLNTNEIFQRMRLYLFLFHEWLGSFLNGIARQFSVLV